MDNYGEQYPLMRITTFGELTLERLMPSACTPIYQRVPPEEWGSRGPAVTLLKVLLCRSHRRAARSELVAAIWPDRKSSDVSHAFDVAASLLRRHVLCAYNGKSLLQTFSSGGESMVKLAAQTLLWVDADALLTLAAQSMESTDQQNTRTLLEAAHSLVQGEFLEDSLDAPWSQRRRHTLNAARRRVLYKLLKVYIEEKRVHLAEELLYTFLEEYPTDEDALYRLMLLLAQQERRREALQIYHYTLSLLHEEQNEPASYTQTLAARIQRGLTLREHMGKYVASKLTNMLELKQNAHIYCVKAFPDFSNSRRKEVPFTEHFIAYSRFLEVVHYACGG